MAYNSLTQLTLTDDERAEEARRILARLDASDMESCGLSDSEYKFIIDRLKQYNFFNDTSCTVAQLLWMRDINGKVD